LLKDIETSLPNFFRFCPRTYQNFWWCAWCLYPLLLHNCFRKNVFSAKHQTIWCFHGMYFA